MLIVTIVNFDTSNHETLPVQIRLDVGKRYRIDAYRYISEARFNDQSELCLPSQDIQPRSKLDFRRNGTEGELLPISMGSS